MKTKTLLSFAGTLLFTVNLWAVPQLIWDPLGNGGTTSGSGNWDTTSGNNVWWNGSADVAWSQASTTRGANIAVFNGPDAAPNTYVVNLDAVQVTATNSFFSPAFYINNNGYEFTGNNALYVGPTNGIYVAPNVTVTFNCPMAGNGSVPFWQLDNGATMNVGGNLQGTQQLRLCGPANSAFNLTGAASVPAQVYVLGPVNVTSGTITPTSSFFIGYPDPTSFNGTSYSSGTLTVSGSGTVTQNKQIFFIARTFGSPAVAGQGTLTIQSGGTVNVGTGATFNLAISYDGGAGENATVNVQGGNLNVGSSSFTGSEIAFFDSGTATGANGLLNQTGGTIAAWGGIVFGPGGGTGTATLTNSGGTLNIGASGIAKGASYSGSLSIGLTGGTVGALASWSSSLPMTLGTANGPITFSPGGDTITLSGALTDGGAGGGLNVTGNNSGGALVLSGANSFSGLSTVSGDTLQIVTGAAATTGPITVDGSTATATFSTKVSNPGQSCSIGALTCQNAISGYPTLDFQFASLAPSTSVAPIQVTGNVNFSSQAAVTVEGAAIANGTYPLIHYTGTLSGTLPANVSVQGASGSITSNPSTKTISLVVTGSSYNPALYWAAGNAAWDTTDENWKQFGNPAYYSDGDAVVFDDTSSGTPPFTVTLNTTVNPSGVTFDNNSDNYTISGTGNINSGSVSLLGSGTVTLDTANSYSGGTTLNSGQLNINNGGTASATAIGTGNFNINGGTIDNTSGSDVTLQASINEYWNGNFTYAGSANNFNTGITGGVVLNTASVTVTVNAMNFTVGGTLQDTSGSSTLVKNGNGALTLAGVGNSFGSAGAGGVTLNAGLLNLGDNADGAGAGQGTFTINGGSIDNVSSGTIILSSVAAYNWANSFSYLGTSQSLNFGGGTITGNTDPNPVTVTVASNTLTTGGMINFGNVQLNKAGNGTFIMTGSVGNSLNLAVLAGQVVCDKASGQSVNGSRQGLIVYTNALVTDSNSFQMHSDSLGSPMPIQLLGGAWDLNGFDENVDNVTIDNGILRDSAGTGTSTIDTISGYTTELSGTGTFDVTESGGILNFKGSLGGTGSLIKVGAGTLNLLSNNIYSGDTIISNGVVALLNEGSLSGTANIDLATTNSILDLTGYTNNSQTLTLQTGQTLSGVGVVTGLVVSVSGSYVAPGSPSTVGTLTVTGIAGNNTLGGTTAIKLDAGNMTNDQLAVSGSLTYGGTLSLMNLSGTLANGDNFTIFNAGGGYSQSFSSISPPRPGYPGFGLAWNTANLANNGVLSVVTAPVPSSPRIVHVSYSSGMVSLTGTNGLANEPFIVLESTNVALPLPQWTPIYTNSFDVNGDCNISFGVGSSPEYMALWMQ